MMGRLLLIAVMSVIGLMIASWMLGEFLRQRKDK
jgi:hypothetical protein